MPTGAQLFSMLNGIGDTFSQGLADDWKRRQELQGTELLNGLVDQTLGGQPQKLADMGTTAPAAAVAPAPQSPAFAGGKTAMRMPADPDAENRFISTIKQGGLTNPYGVAALAAYANAESGYSPSNITGSWADPSQSGQPGTSGGILSWRGPRLAAMQQATAGQSDPVAAQAKFALTENPDVTMALQNAKSPEEANRVLANAWKFAGYDQPGGEYDRRQNMVRAYVNRVGGSAPAATQVASAALTLPGGAQIPAPSSQTAAADMPAPGAQAAAFVIPNAGGPQQTVPVGSPAATTAGRQTIGADQIKALIANPTTRQVGMQIWQAQTQGKDISYHDLGGSLGVFSGGKLISSVAKDQVPEAVREFVWARQNGMTQATSPADYAAEKDRSVHTTNVKPGDYVVDQRSGKVVFAAPAEQGGMFEGKSVEANALNYLVQSGRLTKDQAADFGAGKPVSIDGKNYFMTPGGIFPQDNPSAPVVPFGQGGAQPPAAGGAPMPGAPAAPAAASQPAGPSAPAPAPAAAARPGMIQLGQGKEGNVPSEVGSRLGLANSFLNDDLPWVRQQISSGALSGPIASAQMYSGSGLPGQINRRIDQGKEALVRGLTGAGQSESEARSYASRYSPAWNDSIETINDKLNNLEKALVSTRNGAIAGKNVTDPALTGKGAAQPAAAAPTPKGAPAIGTVSRGFRYIGGDPAQPGSWQQSGGPST